MSDIPNHMSPPYSEENRDDALFHYTSANGLIGILGSKEIWGTAYYCANDESELATGKGILSPLFWSATSEMIKADDPLVHTFSSRGIDIREYAQDFEQKITLQALGSLCAYITCFCKPKNEEDFRHGLLSQWRGYGTDGGYALQFSRKKLLAAIENANNCAGLNYQLQDAYYTVENPLKSEVLSHTSAFLRAYKGYLDGLGKLDFRKKSMPNPLATLLEGPLESLLDYLVHTKNEHFGEERECRLSLVDAVSSNLNVLPINYFNRNGLIVPYKKTPSSSFYLLDCVEWIVVGPGPRMSARFKSVVQMVRQAGLEIDVRPSHIPFTRV
ncbi:DUF2971 domain-containing protein [Collimonas sp. H4R21]|uniref:DUF2971 domain-containing protein n=1 Tax=Collimonas rhizosphaerae TaxID=3126357 RepID=A0ABU9PXX0_9BURK